MTPIRYSPDLEQPTPDEADTFDRIARTFREEGEQVAANEGAAKRVSHAKATALLKGELVVADGLPPELAQGLFARPGRYEVLGRFAQGPGETLHDRVSTHRGFSIKVLGVGGDRIPEAPDAGVQDWLMAVGPTFINSTPKTFVTALTLGVSNAPKLPEGVKNVVSAVARGTEAALEAVGLENKTIKFFGHPKLHPLAEDYFTQVPVRFGDHVAKLGLFPTVDTRTEAGTGPLETDAFDTFRNAMIDHFARRGAEFELRVQLCTDLDRMPIEDAATDWSQDESPYRTVARLTFPPQTAFSEARRRYWDEQLAFNPANALDAHRPLGGIMRARLAVYKRLQHFRRDEQGIAAVAPRSLADVPD